MKREIWVIEESSVGHEDWVALEGCSFYSRPEAVKELRLCQGQAPQDSRYRVTPYAPKRIPAPKRKGKVK